MFITGEEETEDIQCGSDGGDLEHEACKPIDIPAVDLIYYVITGEEETEDVQCGSDGCDL